jgi:hypothetical protein
MSRKFLYRRLGSAVIVILMICGAAVSRSAAQGDKPTLKRPGNTVPDDKPPEPKKKKVKGPRAVGVLQLTSSGKGTLIPIAILIDGKFYDASVYKADPVPMALDSGTVYEVERAGDSQGLFTVSGALHSTSAGSAHPWVGAGSYLPQGTEAPKSTRKAEDVPVGLDSSGGDEPPRLTRGNSAKSTEAASNASAAPTSGTGAAGGSSEKSGAAAPPASAQPSAGGAAGTSSGPSPKAPEASDKPADQAAKEQAPQTPRAPGQAATNPIPSQTSPGQASASQESENYYRPTLRRGKPTQSAPQEDEPVAKADKLGSAGGASTAAAAVPLQTMAAISDAGGPDPRPYQFFWKTGEEEEQRKQMLALAADEVRAYWNARAKGAIGAKPPAAKAGVPTRKVVSKPAQPEFENVQFHTFDVWGNNQPVMILSADAHLPATGASTAPEPCSITLVARTDIYGNLRKLYSGLTDKFHLDVTPRLELIDAVDADGDGRGELLFRETTDAGSGYVIYRATADKLWKMFDSRGE